MSERTLTILKPDLLAARQQGAALQQILDGGFDVVAMRQTILSREQAEAFYEVHRERPFFTDLIAFMTSGPVVVACLERENAVARLRELMGPTDSRKAPESTLRGRFGTDIQYNAVHGSDSAENAAREVSFFFPELA
ncbi:MAG: nucleoside-diphosphate kinase [Acidobacteriota bacterium]|jgi:nucleoside-diphosphate kinase